MFRHNSKCLASNGGLHADFRPRAGYSLRNEESCITIPFLCTRYPHMHPSCLLNHTCETRNSIPKSLKCQLTLLSTVRLTERLMGFKPVQKDLRIWWNDIGYPLAVLNWFSAPFQTYPHAFLAPSHMPMFWNSIVETVPSLLASCSRRTCWNNAQHSAKLPKTNMESCW